MTLEELIIQLDRWGNLKQIIQQKRSSRSYASLPHSFEVEAVAALYIKEKWRFNRHNIKSRMAASKACTFDDLLIAIDRAIEEDRVLETKQVKGR